jgi:hypothetical protein
MPEALGLASAPAVKFAFVAASAADSASEPVLGWAAAATRSGSEVVPSDGCVKVEPGPTCSCRPRRGS